jgi:hypothetical protein
MAKSKLDKLKALYVEYFKLMNPHWTYSVVLPSYLLKNVNSTNSLTRQIIGYIRLNGWFAERISSSGRYIDKTKTFTDSVGFQRQIGSKEWIPGTGVKGTADISATVQSTSLKIEVKNIETKDRQTEAQKVYEKITNISGGIYYIATDILTFIEWFDFNFKENSDKIEVWKFFKSNKIVI